jgi:PAS domain S-box-containing protein
MDSKTNESSKEDTLSKKLYQQLFNSRGEMFQVIELIYDKDGNAIDYYYLKVNRAFKELVNKKEEELIGKRAKEVFNIVEDHWIKTFERVEKTGKPENYQNYGVALDKHYNAYVWKVDEAQVAVVFTDTTELENKNKISRLNFNLQFRSKTIHTSKKFLDDIINNMVDPVFVKDDQSRFILANDAFCSIFNLPRAEVLGKTLAENVPLAEMEHFLKIDNQVLLDGKENLCEETLTANGGKTLIIITKKIRYVDKKGNRFLIGSIHDITKQKQIEKIVLESHRLNAIGNIASSIAHDFNNALQSMMGNLEIIKLQNNLLPSNHERLNSIETTITDVASRVKALQHFGDLKNKSQETEQISFNTIIAESLIQSRVLWKDKMEKEGLIVNIVTDYGDIPKIDCNKGELKSAIYNLIKNSIEAMPEGGKITIKTGVKPEKIFMTFTDTGIGMDKNTKLKLFQPFYTTKGFEAGRGLGMSGVYSIVKKYDGDIKVKFSELDKGTTIELVFPISKKDKINDIKEKTLNDTEFFRILWVDDDATIRENSCEILELLGHKCDAANSGKSALHYLNENPCDIVITDIGMPEMNGWQLTDAVKKKFGTNIKIIVVSGWEIDEKTKNKHGANFTLQKPFTIEELEKLIISF